MDQKLKQDILAKINLGIKQQKLEDCQIKIWDDILENIEVIPTPSARLNAALGVGGIPTGRIIEIFGGESAGKTTLALHLIAEAQKLGKAVGYIDMEHALDASYAENLGVNMSELFICQPPTGDDAMNLCQIMANSGVGLIIVDSVPALVAKAELEKGITDNNIGLIARMLSQGLRQLSPTIHKTNSCLVFINQLREKIGVMFGNPETQPGGRALKHYASVRIRMAATSEHDEEMRTSNISIVKNKVAAPFRKCEVAIIYGKGIDKLSDTVKFAKETGVIKQAGPYYTMPKLDCPGMKLIEADKEIKLRGEEDVKIFVSGTEGYLESLSKATLEAFNNKGKIKLEDINI